MVRLTTKNLRTEIEGLITLSPIDKNLLLEIVTNYLHNQSHSSHQLIPPMVRDQTQMTNFKNRVGRLILNGIEVEIVEAYPDVPNKEVIRLTLQSKQKT